MPWVIFTKLFGPETSPVTSGDRSSVTPQPVNGGIVMVPVRTPPLVMLYVCGVAVSTTSIGVSV